MEVINMKQESNADSLYNDDFQGIWVKIKSKCYVQVLCSCECISYLMKSTPWDSPKSLESLLK